MVPLRKDHALTPTYLRLWACVVVVSAAPATAVSTDAPAEQSLSAFVPAEVGLFIEGRGIGDLLVPLTEPHAWTTLAELGGQPADAREVVEWRLRVRETVQMEPAEAIRVLFGQQFALVGEGLLRAQDAVILCRPTTDGKELLSRWHAQPLPSAGRTSVYLLPSRIGLALPDGLVVLGDAGPADGMFARVLSHVDRQPRGPSLADDPAYRRLLERVPAGPDAVLFARLRPADGPTAASSQPAAPLGPTRWLPSSLRSASNLLLALHRHGRLLHFSVVGDAAVLTAETRGGLTPLVRSLPARTLVVWGTHLDYAALVEAARVLPEGSVLRVALQIQERSGAVQRLTSALGTATCVAVGAVEPATRGRPGPPVPAVALLIAARDGQLVATEVDTLFQTAASLYNLMSLRVGAGVALPGVSSVVVDEREVRLLDLSRLLQAMPGGETIAELHVCWTVHDDTLIIASHLDWLRQIVAARRQQAPNLADMLSLTQRPVADDSDTVVAVQTGPIADLGQVWLDYLAREAPAVLDEAWWRERQPGGQNVRLGIQVTEVPEQKLLRVNVVEPGMPADGVLKPGDQIVGYVGFGPRRFATSQPVREIREALAQRQTPRWVDLLVERGGTTHVRRIPLPFVDLVQLLRRAVALGRIGQRVVYHDDLSDAAQSRGFLTVELRESSEPLFPFALSPPPPAEAQRAAGSP